MVLSSERVVVFRDKNAPFLELPHLAKNGFQEKTEYWAFEAGKRGDFKGYLKILRAETKSLSEPQGGEIGQRRVKPYEFEQKKH